MGHGTIFSLYGMMTFLFLLFYIEERRPLGFGFLSLSISLLASLLLGGFTEFLQRLVPDRGPSFVDVGIDFLGASLGILLAYLVFLFVLLIKKKKKKDPGA